MTARLTLLDGLARDADIFELVSELAPLHPRNNTFPGEVFLLLAADARRRPVQRSDAARTSRCVVALWDAWLLAYPPIGAVTWLPALALRAAP